MKRIRIRRKSDGQIFDATPFFAKLAIEQGVAEVVEEQGNICQVWDLSNYFISPETSLSASA